MDDQTQDQTPEEPTTLKPDAEPEGSVDPVEAELQAIVSGASSAAAELDKRERLKWLTIAEAERTRDDWNLVKQTIDQLAEQLDANPDDPKIAGGFLMMAMQVLGGFTQNIVASQQRIVGRAQRD